MESLLPVHVGGGRSLWPVLAGGRRLASSQRWRMRLLVLLVVLLGAACFASVFFLPVEVQQRLPRLHQLPDHVRRLGGQLLMPPLQLANDNQTPFDSGGDEWRVAQDRARLQQRARSAVLQPPPPLAPPRDQTPRQSSSSAVAPAAVVVSQVPGAANAPVITGAEDPDSSTRQKRDFIKRMMLHAWQGYSSSAWGSNELRPVSRRGHSAGIFGRRSMGATIVDAMDTLYLMGLHEQFDAGRRWIQQNLNVHQSDSDMSLFEMNIRFVGGLLSCYSLTGDVMFRDKAEAIVRSLLPAFNTPTGIPYSLVNPATGRAKNFGWAAGGSSILSEFGTLHMEFAYLSDITGNPEYRRRVERIRDVLEQMEKTNGLYYNYLHPKTGKWSQRHVSVGALGDSFYEYLLKDYLRGGQRDARVRRMYDHAIGNITERLLRQSRQSRLSYMVELQYDRPSHKMDHLACFIGGLYALGSVKINNDQSQRYMQLGREITNTCHESYDRTLTKLGPESFRFTDAVEAKAIKMQEKYYILRPEVIESYFVLWRLTGDRRYREWGWEAAQAIEKHCRAEAGYSGIENVDTARPKQDDLQQSFFLAETLKYLYLLFSDNSLMSLDQWVFNTEAHPLPVLGLNPLYRAAALR